jgi:hypothetical protein
MVWVKLEVEDPEGATAAQLFQVEVLDQAPPDPDPDPPSDAGSTDTKETDVIDEEIVEVDISAPIDARRRFTPDTVRPDGPDLEAPGVDASTTEEPPPASSRDRGCRQTQNRAHAPWMLFLLWVVMLSLRRWRRGLQ